MRDRRGVFRFSTTGKASLPRAAITDLTQAYSPCNHVCDGGPEPTNRKIHWNHTEPGLLRRLPARVSHETGVPPGRGKGQAATPGRIRKARMQARSAGRK